MNAFLKRLHTLGDDELLGISEAIDIEMERRQEHAEVIHESARQRANARQQSYRHGNGSSAPPIRMVGLRDTRRPRAA